MASAPPLFIAEVSSNHSQKLSRCLQFVRAAADIGCDAVKFQLFKIDQLFAPEVLTRSEEHRSRAQWELPLAFLPEIANECKRVEVQFGCTPFYLDAVEQLLPYVDFFKIASYELPWLDLIKACAQTKKPLYLSTGMANLDEIDAAVAAFKQAGGTELTLFHCVSGYPVPPEHCNLAAIKTLRDRYGVDVGWSDHSRKPGVVTRALERWRAQAIEFHLDLDEQGEEYGAGHCWLPSEMQPVIEQSKAMSVADGSGIKEATDAERHERLWRADPADGLRPFKEIRSNWWKK